MHAVERLYSIYPPEEQVPNMVAIGVRNKASLERALAIVKGNQIPHYAWSEPDNDLGFTSFATVPIDSEQKKIFEKYRLWIDNTGGEIEDMQSVFKSLSFDANPCTNSPSVASGSAFNGEGGANTR